MTIDKRETSDNGIQRVLDKLAQTVPGARAIATVVIGRDGGLNIAYAWDSEQRFALISGLAISEQIIIADYREKNNI
jgi:hypothetical protein